MDGIALHSSKTIGASEKHPIILKKDYLVVDTGDPVPREYDCVIMVEDIIEVDSNRIQIHKSVAPWQNIRPLGEDIVENQFIIPSGDVIRPQDIGAMLAGGVNKVEAYKKPLVGIIPTGTELVQPESELKIGDIIADLGKVHIHGAAIKPGKPVIMGEIHSKIVLGIPGYPVSAYFIMEKVLKRIVESYQGLKSKEEEKYG